MAQPTYTKVQSRGAHRSYTKDFLKLMQEVYRREGWREEQTLTHWLTTASCALRGPLVQFNPGVYAKNEAAYMQVVKACRHPDETMRDFTEAFAVIVNALEEEPADVLTPIFTEVASSANLGQFFTPWSVSYMMAKLMLEDAPNVLQRCRDSGRNYITCEEPACGVGGMIMAANMVFREHGLDPARDVHWVATDVDLRAVNGAFVQVCLSGGSATVVHGNTISLETWDVLTTFAAVMHPKRVPLTTQRARVPDAEEPVTVVAAPVVKAGKTKKPGTQLGFDLTF